MKTKKLKLFVCENCNEEFDSIYLNIHHNNRTHNDNSPSNLKNLCIFCHGKEHGYEGAEVKLENTPYDTTDEIDESRAGYRLLSGFQLIDNQDEDDKDFGWENF